MYHIIIVEDDPMVASINEQYLLQNPSFVLDGSFNNGRDALDYLKNAPVDLAIVDNYMPIMDGMAFVRSLREASLPVSVIMITAANTAQDIADAMRFGIVDYIIKPFTFERFQASIDKFIYTRNVLGEHKTFDQKTLDGLFRTGGDSPGGSEIPVKGIQPQTLERIQAFLKEHKEDYLSCDEIAGETALSRITVRRYLNYLLAGNRIVSRVDYATGGRPSIRYRIVSK